ncbi:MAG: ATP-binding protein [Myxococcota bacterium]
MQPAISPQALYEIALTVGSSQELQAMLRTTLTAFVQQLGAQAGAVYRVTHTSDQAPRVTRVIALSREAHEADLQTAQAHLKSEGPLPAEVPGMDGQLCLAEIPGFGALCLIAGRTPLPTSTLMDLAPLLSAVGRACRTCDYIEEEERRSEAQIMAEMLDARTRELAARTRELDAALQRTRDVSRLKEELLASLSHELRTPLNAVLGLAEALQEEIYGPLTREQAESIQVIERSGRKLLALLTDMMDFVRIGSGQMTTSFNLFDLSETAQVAVQRERKALKAKGIRLALVTGSDDLEVLSDAIICQRIVGELLSNAIKFTTEGGRISVDVEEAAETVVITVTDDGCGISEGKLSRLFEPFVQIEGGLKRRYGGTGLGLALSSRLARLIGAELNVKSVKDEGSEFSLTIYKQGPKKLEIFGDLNCPYCYTLNMWMEESRLSHLIAWRGVEQFPALTVEQANSETGQALLDTEFADIAPRCHDVTINRPVRRSHTHAALSLLKYIELEMPGRLSAARTQLFEAIWVHQRDISDLASVKAALPGFSLEHVTPGAREEQALRDDIEAWRADPDPCIPTVVSPRRGARHRGLGHRALLQQFLDTELGFVGPIESGGSASSGSS